MDTPAPDWIAHHAALSPQHPAAIDPTLGTRLTYREFDDRIGRIATALRHRWSVGRGDRVGYLGYNGVDAFAIQFACGRVGALFTPLNWRLSAAEIGRLVELGDPSVLLVDPALRHLVPDPTVTGVRPPLADLGASFDDAVAEHQALPSSRAAIHGDPWALMFTSGTTGRPKGAVQTHGMAFWNAVNLCIAAGIDSQTVSLVMVPCFHTTGLNVYANPTFHAGGTVVCPPRFVPHETLALLGDERLGITHTMGVPAMWQALASLPEFEATPVDRLESRGVGGATPSAELLRSYADRGAPLEQGYGMTETGPTQLVVPTSWALDKSDTVGRPVMHGRARLVDSEGQDVAIGQRGELWVQGPLVTPGYWNDVEATEAAFTDGWFRTGDVMEVDADGFYVLVDRLKDMFVSGGENIYPAEVERVLLAIDGVADAAVVALPDETWGQVGVAWLLPAAGRDLDVDDIRRVCRSQLAGYKVPYHFRLIGELPRNAAGKVLKGELVSARPDL